MKCGLCGEDMEKGEAAIRYTGWGIFFFGASYKHLFYKKKGDGPDLKKVILRNNECATAYWCKDCNITTISGDGQPKNLIHW